MIENKTKEVAKLLGLELEEEFKIEGHLAKYKFTEAGLMHWPIYEDKWVRSASLNDLIAGELTIIKLSKPILTEKEREYLSAVFKPFRDRILHIYKFDELMGYEGIGIDLKFPKIESHDDAMTLPCFEKGTMYKGMELYKDYTVEELGL